MVDWNAFSSFDEGGGGVGPYLRWHARATEDGLIPGGNWSLRHAGSEREIVSTMGTAFLVDLGSLKTGWERSGGMKGVAPDRVWGDSPKKRPPRPEQSPDEWHPALSVRIGVSKTLVAEWTQGGAGAWQGLCHLMRQVTPTGSANAGKVPALRQTGALRSEKGKGVTLIPQFALLGWVVRPALFDGVDEGTTIEGVASALSPAARVAQVMSDKGEWQPPVQDEWTDQIMQGLAKPGVTPDLDDAVPFGPRWQ